MMTPLNAISHIHMLYAAVQKYTIWNIHWTHHRSHWAVPAIHHLSMGPVARFKDGCVNFRESEWAAKQQRCVLLFHLTKIQVSFKLYAKWRQGTTKRRYHSCFLLFFSLSLWFFLPHIVLRGAQAENNIYVRVVLIWTAYKHVQIKGQHHQF